MKRTLRLGLLLLLALLWRGPGIAAQEKEAPKLTVTSIRVEPEKPAADTLCKLHVTLKNNGEAIASQLGFDVTINGQKLLVYDNQLFMFPVPAGEEAELQLYNFWTTETSRAFPKDAKLKVDVALREAQWMEVKMEKDEEGEIEVWRPLGEVGALPSTQSVTLQMTR